MTDERIELLMKNAPEWIVEEDAVDFLTTVPSEMEGDELLKEFWEYCLK